MAEDEIRRADDIGRSERRNLSPRAIAAIVLAVIVLVFALLNLQKTNIDFGFSTVSMPLVFAIALTAAIGFGAGFLVRGRRDRND